MEAVVDSSDSDDWKLTKKLVIAGALLGPVLLYLAGYFIRHDEDAYGLVDYFWSIPAGAITGYLLPNAWPAKKD